MLHLLIKVLSHARAKEKTERLKGFQTVHFDWSFSSDIMAVKGLKRTPFIRTKQNVRSYKMTVKTVKNEMQN